MGHVRLGPPQEFFLCLPGWLLSGGIYLLASKLMQKKAGVEGGNA